MIKLPLSVVRVAVFCLPLALVAGCGPGGGYTAPTAPPGSTITVSPGDVPWTVAVGACTNADMQDTIFNIAVKSPSGTPLTGVGIAVNLVLAPGSAVPGLQTMYLYDDLGGDGLYTDQITVLPYYTQTGSSGTKMLMVRYDLGGCEFGGNLDVFSGTAYGFGHISAENP